MSDITQKWKESGLLQDLSEEQSNELAKIFEDLTQYVASLNETIVDFFIFPAVRKIYADINKPGKFPLVVNTVDLFWDLNNKWIIFKKKYSELTVVPGIDMEAMFICEYCEDYIEDLKKRGLI
jgi:galactose-1-phosphate uridylyltransferase